MRLPGTDNSEAVNSEATLADPVFLGELRSQMLKFATLQMGDAHAAEDAVQEALIGALKNANSFGGRAALKTWVFAILKNKIADALRQKQRLVNASTLLGPEDEDEILPTLFDRVGHWNPEEAPTGWGNPEAAFREGQFWVVFEACLSGLPAQQGRVFMMREFVELDTGEICATVGISVSNLHVLLHRARLRLRDCLETNWYGKGAR